THRRLPGPEAPHLRSGVLLAFAGLHDLRGVDGVAIDLDLLDLAIFPDEISDSPRSFPTQLVVILDDPVSAGDLAAPVAQQGESDAVLLRERIVREGAIHAYTQDLGV